MLNSLIASSIGEKINSVVEWVGSHVSPNASNHFSPFGLLPEISLSYYFGTQAIMMVLVTVIILVLFGISYKKGAHPKGKLTNFLELFVLFVRDEIVYKNFGEKEGKGWVPFFLSLFLFVLGCNLIGLIPGNATATGSFYVTGSLAVVTLICLVGATTVKYGISGLIRSFVPQGVPGWVLIILCPIEVFGMFVKCSALMIRLFANMLAGHIVLYSMIGLIYVFGILAAPAFLIAVGVYALEFFVACLQAYLFAFLSAMFLSEMFHHAHPHHDHDEHAHDHAH